MFNIFASLWAISTAAARRSYFRWSLDKLWPNIYTLFVADPAFCHKGAAPGKCQKILKALSGRYQNDPVMRAEKRFNIMNSNTSPEFLYELMEPRIEHFILPDGTIHKENYGSKLTIWADELTTLINGKKYTSGMIENLTSWFDCLDESESGTKASGRRMLQNIYVTLIGAMTPEHLRNSLPAEAYTSGFMSRCIVVYQQNPTVLWPEPVDFPGTPTKDQLIDRLVWLTYNIRGEYDLTPEAREYYREWYIDYQTKAIRHETTIAYYARARFTQTVLRIATIARMSEYRPGREITLAHLKWAIALLSYVFALQDPIVADVNVSAEAKPYVKIREIISREGEVRRPLLVRRMSARNIMVMQVNQALMQLHEEGLIAYILNGKIREGHEPLNNGGESYRWIAEGEINAKINV